MGDWEERIAAASRGGGYVERHGRYSLIIESFRYREGGYKGNLFQATLRVVTSQPNAFNAEGPRHLDGESIKVVFQLHRRESLMMLKEFVLSALTREESKLPSTELSSMLEELSRRPEIFEKRMVVLDTMPFNTRSGLTGIAYRWSSNCGHLDCFETAELGLACRESSKKTEAV